MRSAKRKPTTTEKAIVPPIKGEVTSQPIFKLGPPVTDTATGLKGMLTVMHVDMDHSRTYNFQPKGLNPESGEPIDSIWLVGTRVKGGETVTEEELNLPYSILGTEVTDKASGFTGTAVSLVLHISGCVHVNVQPDTKLKASGSLPKACNFDIRRLEGPALRKLTEQQIKKDREARPSPISYTRPVPRSSHFPSSPR